MFEKKCSCEQGYHRAPLQSVDIGRGVIAKLPEVLADYQSIYLVADERTYAVAGETAERLLKEAGKEVHHYILEGEDILPNALSLGNILIHMRPLDEDVDINEEAPQPDLILAVGSGVINDCCRLLSRRTNIPYAICGTAPSMDGYASAGSPTLHDGTKSTIKGTTPRHIICDTAIAAGAPFSMLQAGLGDMMAKFTGLIDWEIARDLNGDYYCPEVAQEVMDATKKCVELSKKVYARDPDAMDSLFEGFVVTGIGMAYTGCSRPASGSEHMIAHAFELEAVERGDMPNLHGIEVAQGTRIVIYMYRRLYGETTDTYMKNKIEEFLPVLNAADEICKEIPLAVTDREEMIRGIYRGHKLRNRYTILQYLFEKGLLDSYAEGAADALLNL